MPDRTPPPSRASQALRAPRPWFALCFVLIVVIGSYLPVLGAPFVWDDHHLIEDSPLIQELHPLRDYFGRAFWQTDELGQDRSYYRPLTILSLAVDHSLYGEGSEGYHLSNLMYHLLCAVLLFRLLCVRGASGGAAALGTLLWSLHPRLTEAVAWISGRTDVLASLFVLAALLAQARPSAARRIACALLLFCALLCKEVALAGVAAALVFELTSPGSVLARVRRALPTLVALGAYLVLRVSASGISTPRAVPISTLLMRAAAAVGQYFVMLLTPWWPNLQIGQLSAPRLGYAALGGAVLLGSGALLLRLRARFAPSDWSALTLGAVGLGLVVHLVHFSINVIAADRFLYLPLLALSLLLTPVLALVANSGVLVAALGLLSLSFAGATFVRASAWADEVTLWSRTFHENPDNEFLACTQLGRLYVRAGLLSHAFSLYRGCTVTPGQRFVPTSNAAAVLALTGRYRAASALLDSEDESVRQKPLVALNQALISAYRNDFSAARSALNRALNADPKSETGRLLAQQLPALEQARRELDALPSPVPPEERAALLQNLGLSAEAVTVWQAALASGSLSADQLRVGLSFVVKQGDAATIEALHDRYSAELRRFALDSDYAARHALGQRLLAIWPSLQLPLLPWPSAIDPRRPSER